MDRFPSRLGPKAPVVEGKVYRMKIVDLGSTGDGIARVEGFVVFVKDTVPGEEVDVRIVRVGERSAVGVVVKKA